MNHLEFADRIAEELAGDSGWERLPEHHFRHPATGVHLMVYAASVSVVFGNETGHPYAKAVAARTAYFPATALAAVVEVARALVVVRSLALAGERDDGLPAGATGVTPD